MYEVSRQSIHYNPAGFKKRSASPGSVNPFVFSGSIAKQVSFGQDDSLDSEDDVAKILNAEKQTLLDDARRFRSEDKKKTVYWLVAWTIFFGLIMSGVVFFATRRNVPVAVREVLDESLDKFVAKWSSKMGIDECNRLDSRYLLFQNQVTGNNISSWSLRTPSVFFLQEDAELTYDQACSMESFASLLAELVVYALQLKCTRTTADAQSTTLKKVLAEGYKNFVPLGIDGKTYFKGTPVAGAFQCRSRRSTDEAMVITSWRFGGLAVYPDVVVKTRRFIRFPANQIQISRHYVISYTRCSPPLFYHLSRLHSAPYLTDLEPSTYAKEGFDTLCCAGVCPDVVTDDSMTICDEDRCPLSYIANITKVAQYCPRTWKELEDSYRATQPTEKTKNPR